MDLLKLIRETMEAEKDSSHQVPELGALPEAVAQDDTSGSPEPEVEESVQPVNVAGQEPDDELSIGYPDQHLEAGLSLPEQNEPDFQSLDATPASPQNFHSPDEPEVEGQPSFQEDQLDVNQPTDQQDQDMPVADAQVAPENDLPLTAQPTTDISAPQVENAPDAVSYDLPIRESNSYHDEQLSTTGSPDPMVAVSGFRQMGFLGESKQYERPGEEQQMSQSDDTLHEVTAQISEEMSKGFSEARHDLQAFYNDRLQDELLLNRIIGGFV